MDLRIIQDILETYIKNRKIFYMFIFLHNLLSTKRKHSSWFYVNYYGGVKK